MDLAARLNRRQVIASRVPALGGKHAVTVPAHLPNAAAPGVPSLPEASFPETTLRASPDDEWLHGLGMVPSWTSQIGKAWWFYDGARLREEVALARRTHVNCGRLRIEFPALQLAPRKVAKNFMDTVASNAEKDVQVKPRLSNRRHDSQFDCGGTDVQSPNVGWMLPPETVRALATALAADDCIFAWHLWNKLRLGGLADAPSQPEFQWRSEINTTVRGCWSRQPILAVAVAGEGHIRLYAPLSKVFRAAPNTHTAGEFCPQVAPLEGIQTNLSKPLLVHEHMPGCLDDATWAQVSKFYHEQLSSAGFGWMGWPLRESLAISTRRERDKHNKFSSRCFHPFFSSEGRLWSSLEFFTERPRLKASREL